jgi:hypothetical protein
MKRENLIHCCEILPFNSRVRKNLVRTMVYKGHFVVCN